MQVQIRNMSENDVSKVVSISNLSFSSPWSEASYRQEIKNPASLYLVAEYNNDVIGFIGTWNVLDESHITNVAVHPEFRKLKVGSLLLEKLIEISSSEYGSIYFDLEVRKSNIAAQKLYSKYNFIETGIRKNYYTDTKEDAILMCRKN